MATKIDEEETLESEIQEWRDAIDESQYYRGDKNLPKDGAQFAWDEKMVKELDKCTKDILHFATNHFYIVNVDRGKEKIDLYTAQKRILRCMTKNRFVTVLASRQIGKTTMMTIYALWLTCFFKYQRIIIVANKENTAINIFRKIRIAYEGLPNFLKPGVKEYGKTGVIFANGSSIGISTTTSSAARGDSANVLIIDEAAFIDTHFMEEFWKSVIPIISSGKTTKIFMVSTPNGVGNKFYEIFSAAEKGENAWVAERVDWWEVPGRTEAWKAKQIQIMGSEKDFEQEYGNHFVDDAEGAVGGDIIEGYKNNKRKPIWVSDDGTYKVFSMPDPNKIYVIGVDVGEGIGKASTVAQVLDVTDLTAIKQVAVYATNTLEPYHYANRLFTLCGSWGNPPTLIERNNCGAQLIDHLAHELAYEQIVCYAKLSPSNYKNTRHMGIFSHNNIRFAGIANLRYWMNSLRAVDILDQETVGELETFIRYPNGVYRKKSDKFFDDRVLSLVWALFILDSEICQTYFNIVDYDTQGKPLLLERNGYFNADPSTFVVRDLQTQIITLQVNSKIPEPPPLRPSAYMHTDFFNIPDDVDMETLEEMGFTILRP